VWTATVGELLQSVEQQLVTAVAGLRKTRHAAASDLGGVQPRASELMGVAGSEATFQMKIAEVKSCQQRRRRGAARLPLRWSEWTATVGELLQSVVKQLVTVVAALRESRHAVASENGGVQPRALELDGVRDVEATI
jgi:hypothetical protein